MMEVRKKGRPAPSVGCWLQSIWGGVVFLGAGEADGRSFGMRKLQRQRWREAARPSGNMEESGVVEVYSVGMSCVGRLTSQAAW